jgi:manganese/zinc/iron transport system ATP- binding protein
MTQNQSEHALSCKGLTVHLSGKCILKDVDFTIPKGKLCAIIGPNGAGKSTLIRTALGMTPISSGQIEMFGKNSSSQKSKIGYVPQKETVDWDFPVTVYDVVLMGTYAQLGLFRRPKAAHHELVQHCLQQLDIVDIRNRQISELSGGQQQRVFLARALAQQAQIYFMDEPFVGVDATTEQKIIQILKSAREQGTSLFVVHHDLQTVQQYFDYVVMLNQSVIAAGPVDDVFTSESLKTLYGGRLHWFNDSMMTEARK